MPDVNWITFSEQELSRINQYNFAPQTALDEIFRKVSAVSGVKLEVVIHESRRAEDDRVKNLGGGMLDNICRWKFGGIPNLAINSENVTASGKSDKEITAKLARLLAAAVGNLSEGMQPDKLNAVLEVRQPTPRPVPADPADAADLKAPWRPEVSFYRLGTEADRVKRPATPLLAPAVAA